MALIYREYPAEAIKALREGDYFFEEKIIRILKQFGYYKMTAENGAVYTAHCKPEGCNIFRRTEPTKYERRNMLRKQRKAGGNETP
jgi:hypothetical protein